VEGLLAARMVSNMVILRAELNYSRNVKRRNTHKILQKLAAGSQDVNAVPWSRTENVECVVANGNGSADPPARRL
jgi:hypothetical protein